MQNEENSVENQKSIERGERLRKLRSLTGLSLVALSKLVGVTRVTMHYWQSGKPPGMSSNGAQKIVDALKERSIDCSYEWLWLGIGDEPSFSKKTSEPTFSPSMPDFPADSIFSIQNEINLFVKTNKDAVVIKIESTGLRPFFQYRDIVAGTWQPLNIFYQESFCIVNLNGMNQLKWIKKIDKAEGIASISDLPSSKTEKINLEKIAPIIRLWR